MMKKIVIGLVVIMVLAMILSFEKVGNTVGDWFKVSAGRVSNVAKTVFITALGLFLISSGAAAMAVPVVGVALIVIGLVLVGFALWPLFTGKKGE